MQAQTPPAAARSILELRYYLLRNGPQVARTTEYLQHGVVPACARAGIGPIGCFSSLIAPNDPFLMTVTSYPSLAGFEAARQKLAADQEFQAAAALFNATPELSYMRMESSLLQAFAAFPAIVPPPARENRPDRIFELRTYESPNDKTLARKIKMFSEDGEINVFRRLGIVPVFFGQTIVGPRMPNLAYMTAFDDLASREKLWNAFSADPEWQKIRTGPETSNPEVVSTRTLMILRPLAFSPIR